MAMMAFVLSALVFTRPRTAIGTLSRAVTSRPTRIPIRSLVRLQHAPTRVDAAPSLIPSCAPAKGLQLLNSLTQMVEPFEPIDERLIKWYVCGPTVYDSAHVGHARNYVAFDIVRRVLIDYFGFDILYVMNITDIDDKIILRTHFNHLRDMVRTVANADEADQKITHARKAAEAVLSEPKPELIKLLDAQKALATATAGSAFRLAPCDIQTDFLQLTAAYEAEFFADMSALNVLPPDAVTRVTDYVPEVIAYIQQIMDNGYCYESNGSVYFDTAAFSSADGKTYGKLDPTKVRAGQAQGTEDPNSPDWTEGKSAAELLEEGEGSLSAAESSEKRHSADFVLWKASKVGEPSWPSPWGKGRPGWHIECSAMASDLLGDRVDLNSGGVDLKFPHHENQIAQAEAHYDCCSWVNYFLHSGHLHIDGLKMSKSLKNFITIGGALEQYSAAQIRFLFLMRRFSEPMEYSENTLAAAADLERRFNSFSTSLSARLQEASAAGAAPDIPPSDGTTASDGPAVPHHKWGPEERELHAMLHSRRAAVHSALLDSIDTPTAMKALEQLIRSTNVYMTAVPDATRGATLLGLIQRYFDRMMLVFGVKSTVAGTSSEGAPQAGASTASGEQVARTLSSFRDQLRQKAIAVAKGNEGDVTGAKMAQEILQLCDALRDEILPEIGVQLDDRPSGVAQLQMLDPRVLKAEQERKVAAAAKAAEAKLAKQATRQAVAAREAARAAVPPEEMFAPEHDALFEREASYKALDEEGLPLENASGEPLSKSQRKKLVKQREKQAKVHAVFLGGA